MNNASPLSQSFQRELFENEIVKAEAPNAEGKRIYSCRLRVQTRYGHTRFLKIKTQPMTAYQFEVSKQVMRALVANSSGEELDTFLPIGSSSQFTVTGTEKPGQAIEDLDSFSIVKLDPQTHRPMLLTTNALHKTLVFAPLSQLKGRIYAYDLLHINDIYQGPLGVEEEQENDEPVDGESKLEKLKREGANFLKQKGKKAKKTLAPLATHFLRGKGEKINEQAASGFKMPTERQMLQQRVDAWNFLLDRQGVGYTKERRGEILNSWFAARNGPLGERAPDENGVLPQPKQQAQREQIQTEIERIWSSDLEISNDELTDEEFAKKYPALFNAGREATPEELQFLADRQQHQRQNNAIQGDLFDDEEPLE